MVLLGEGGARRGVAAIAAMTTEIDILRAANLVIKRHGETAWLEAAQRADALLEAGDVAGAALWRRILKAVEQLQDEQPPGEGATLH